jgi:hypothetical protein
MKNLNKNVISNLVCMTRILHQLHLRIKIFTRWIFADGIQWFYAVDLVEGAK